MKKSPKNRKTNGKPIAQSPEIDALIESEARKLAEVRGIFETRGADSARNLDAVRRESLEPRPRCLAAMALGAAAGGKTDIFNGFECPGLEGYRALPPQGRHALLDPVSPGHPGLALRVLFEEDNPLLWISALKCLGSWSGGECVPIIAAFLDSPRPRIARAALIALGLNRAPESILYLPFCGLMEHHLVNHALLFLFGRLEPVGFRDAVLSIPDMVRSGTGPGGNRLTAEMAKNVLGKVAVHASGEAAAAARGILAGMGLGPPDAGISTPGRIVPPIIAPRDLQFPPVPSGMVAQSIGRKGPQGDYDLATALFELESHIEGNRLNALALLQESGTPETLEAVRLATHDTDKSVRLKALKTFIALKKKYGIGRSPGIDPGQGALAGLVRIFEGGSRRARISALRGMDLSTPGLLEFLVSRIPAETDGHALAMMSTMTGMLGGPSELQVLLPLLENPDDRVRANTVESLIYLGDEDAFRHMIPLLNDGNRRVQGNVREALSTLDTDSAMKLLTDLAYSPEEPHRIFAAYAVGLTGQRNTMVFVGLLKGMFAREESSKVLSRIARAFATIYSRFPSKIALAASEKFIAGVTDTVKKGIFRTVIEEVLGLSVGAASRAAAGEGGDSGSSAEPVAESATPFEEVTVSGPESFDAGIQSVEEPRAESPGAAEESRGPLESIEGDLASPDPNIRRSALDSLRAMGEVPDRMLEILDGLSKDPDASVRYGVKRLLRSGAPAGRRSGAPSGHISQVISRKLLKSHPPVKVQVQDETPRPPLGDPVPQRDAKVSRQATEAAEVHRMLMESRLSGRPAQGPATSDPVASTGRHEEEGVPSRPEGMAAEEGTEPPGRCHEPAKTIEKARSGKPGLAIAAFLAMVMVAIGALVSRHIAVRALEKTLAAARAEFLADRKFEALDLYMAAAEEAPESVEALTGLAYCLYYTGRFTEAERAVELIGRLNPKSTHYGSFKALAHLFAGDSEKAIDEYSKVLMKSPGLVDARYCLAMALKEAGFIERAMLEAARVIEEEPDHTNAMILFAEIAISRGLYADAEALLTKVLSKNPEHAHALRFFGITMHRSGNYGRSIESLEKALSVYRARNWASREIEYALGSSMLASGDFEGAVKTFSGLAKASPGDIESRMNLAVALGKSGDPEGEKAQYREVLAIDPENPRPFYNLGILYFNDGDLLASERMFSQAAKLDPAMADAHFNLGVVRHRAGDVLEAAACYRRALEAAPGHPGATAVLRSMGGR